MKTKDPRGEGYAWLMPCLTVKDVAKAMDFYEKAFGFEKRFAMPPGKDGKIPHGEVKYKDMVIMLGAEGAQGCETKTPLSGKFESPMGLYVYYEDVDDSFERAVKAGAKEVSKPEDMFWGDRIAQVKDLDGYGWFLATNVRAFDPLKVPAY
jgi:PhnB protein